MWRGPEREQKQGLITPLSYVYNKCKFIFTNFLAYQGRKIKLFITRKRFLLGENFDIIIIKREIIKG